MLRPDEVEEVLKAVELHAHELSDWETEFMDSIRRQWDERGSLTDKQTAKLDEIFEKHLGRRGR